MKIAAATLNQHPINWDNNLKNIKTVINQAIDAEVDLLCLPELCITGYGCEDLFLGEWIYESAWQYLNQLVEYTQGIAVNFGLPICFEGQKYNCSVFVVDQEIKGITAKQFLAKDGVHYEPRWFMPWVKNVVKSLEVEGKVVPFGDVIYEYQGKKIAFEICEDAWREDRPAIRHQEKGVDIILNPSASHFAFGKTEIRKNLIVNSSKDYDCLYVYANLLGNEAGRMIYDGEILIADRGVLKLRNTLLSFKETNICVFDTEQNINQIAPIVSKNEEFRDAVSLALFDYMRKSFSKGYVLSLSGGADSSACAVLVTEMTRKGIAELGYEGFVNKTQFDSSINEEELKAQILTTAYQATINSSDSTFNSAKDLADSLGATFHSWYVDNEVNGYREKIEKAINRPLTWEQDDIALQNIQARSRSPIIWMLTNVTGGLLITTSNRSEGNVGYATMDGDTSGSIAPISGVDKHFVRNWLVWAEKELAYFGLKRVNQMAPTAELRPGEEKQTDEDDLMPYDLMVEIELLAIKNYMKPLQVFIALKDKVRFDNQLLKLYIKKFYTLWAKNQWKRERLAPAFHLDEHNVDPRTWYRFPILSGGFTRELAELDRY